MSDSDILAAQLFIASLAAGALAVAMTQAGWTHRWFVRGMFALAAVLAALAVFWRQVAPFVLPFDEFLSAIAASRSAWFLIGASLSAVALSAAAFWQRKLNAPRDDLEIVFEQTDRFIRRNAERGITQYLAGIRNNTSKTVFFPSLRAEESEFIKLILGPHFAAVGTSMPRDVGLWAANALDPDAFEIVDLFEISDEPIGVYRFSLKAYARDTRTAVAEFEYDSAAIPRIRKLS